MKRIVFKCSENMNKFQEVFEFEDDATEEEIHQEFVDWVWNQIGDYYSWYEEGYEEND